MSITVKCLGCGKVYKAADGKAGLRIQCSQCKTLIEIPVPEKDDTEAAIAADAPKEKGRSRLERALVWGGIAMLAIVIGIEWHARQGYSATLDRFREAVREDEKELFTFSRAKEMVSGSTCANCSAE